MNKKNTLKKGISLIVLIVTIIVIIILAGTVILSLANNNPIAQAQLATNLTEVKAVQTALDMYLISNIDTNGKYKSYPIGGSVVSTDLDAVMKERVSIGQGVALSEYIDYSTLFYLNKDTLGLSGIKDKKYFIDTKNGIVYINNGIELANGMSYILSEAVSYGTRVSKLYGTVYASGNNTYVVKNNSDMYAIGESGIYNPMLLSSGLIYDINTQPQKVDIGYVAGDKIYKNASTTLILKSNGDVYGLGGNTNGELGLGDTYPRYTLTKLPLSNIKEIYSTTSGSIFALTNSGTLLAAGSNTTKTIKNTTDLQVSQFTNITYTLDGGTSNIISGIAKFAACGDVVYVELSNGQVWAWGENEFAVLVTGSGNGTFLPLRETEIENLKTTTGSTIKKFAMGSSQVNFVLLNNGQLYAKGYGGVDGVPGSTNTTVYTKIFDNTKDIVSESTINYLLDNNGDVYSWGNNATYSAGLDTATTYYVPTKLSLSNISRIEKVLALSADGKMYRIGKTGDVLNKQIDSIPVMKDIYTYLVSVDVNDNLWLWGDNSYGQLSVADKGNKNLLARANISNVKNIKTGSGTYVVQTNDGKLYGSGANTYNQLSSASTNSIVDVTNINFAGTVIDYAVAERNIYLIDSNNDLWGIGNSSYKQMGEMGASTTFVKYTAQSLKFKKVYAKNRMVMVLTTDGKLYACGQDDYGEIGLGAGTGVFGSSRVATFTQVINDINMTPIDFSKLVEIESGGSFSVALMNDGSVYATGLNTSGQLGLSDYNFRSRWTRNTFFDGKPKVIDIAVGSNFTAFLLENGDVYTAGNNSYGQFGNGTKISSNVPVKANISDVKSISAGSGHVVAVKNDDTVWSYGKGSHGQLGNGKIAQDVVSPERAYELEK